ITSDVAQWDSALARKDFAGAVALHRGPFLRGFHVSGSLEFDGWVETTRSQLSADYRRALEVLATNATAAGKLNEAVGWWRRLAAEDRFSSQIALGLMHALAEAGDRAGALEFVRVHERIVWAELESAPDPAVVAFANGLRTSRARWPETKTEMTVVANPEMPALGVADTTSPMIVPAAPHRRTWPSRKAHVSVATAALVVLGVAYGVIGQAHGRPIRDARTARRVEQSSSTGSALARPPVRSVRYETSNIAAHELYEHGRDPTLLRSDSGVWAAIGYLRRAVALDTTYAAAYAALAGLYTTAAYGITLPKAQRGEMYARAEAAARRAIALDDSLADAHAELGYTLMVGFNPAAGSAELERAVALDPSASATGEALAKAYEWLGRPADAVAAAQRAVRANPLSAGANAELGDALYFAGRYDEALNQFSKVAGIQPPLRRAPEYVAEVYLATSRWSDAIALLRPREAHEPLMRGLLGYALARSGAHAEAMRLLAEMLADESAGLAPASGIAELYVALGDYDRAFVWLDRAFDDYSLGPWIMGPLFQDIRADPRFERINRRLGRVGSGASLPVQ
ncbi:MAG TPA: BTAD domain-containing putative transcriptional regulator, partial [Gemmatimonadaceae bacterium]